MEMGIKKLKADDSNTTESFKGDIPKNDIPNVHWSRRDDYENKMNWMGLDNLLKFYFEIIINKKISRLEFQLIG